MNNHDSFEMYEEVEKYHQERKGIFHDSKTFSDFDRSYSTYMVLCQDLKQIKMRIFHRKINICSLSCIYAII